MKIARSSLHAFTVFSFSLLTFLFAYFADNPPTMAQAKGKGTPTAVPQLLGPLPNIPPTGLKDPEVIPGKYIVMLKRSAKRNQFIKHYRLANILRRFRFFNGFTARMSKSAADKLRADSRIQYVTPDLVVRAVATFPQITPMPDQTASEGAPFTSPTPEVTGTQPISWGLIIGSAGMTINASTGVVSWPNPVLGSHLVFVSASNSAGTALDIWMLNVTSSVTPPDISPMVDQTIPEGTPYTGPTPVVSGTAPISWSLNAGPAGMTINTSTGVVSWPNPTQMSTLVQIKAENVVGSDIETWMITVAPVGTPPQIAEIPDQTIQEGTPYTGPTPVASGTTPMVWSLNAGPIGMTINASTGVVSWPNPTQMSTLVQIKAENGSGEDIETWMLTVQAPATPPQIAAIPNQTIQEGTAYTGPTPVASGTTPITWSLVAGPTGMTMNSSGVVSWSSPTSSGSPHTVTIRATNSVGSDDESWALAVSAPSPIPEIGAIPDDTIQEGAPYTGPTPVASGAAPFTWTLQTGPAGMTIDSSTGVVSWDAPTSDGSPHTVTIRAANSVGSDDETWSLTVLGQPGGGNCADVVVGPGELPTGVGRIGGVGDGCGVNVAVIDTGIDTTHPDLQENYKGGVNLVDGGEPPSDDNGHGTHVAGIIGALANGSGVVGVSPNVNLYAVKVLGPDGSGSLSNVIAGIDWAVQNNMDIINLSLGANDSFNVFLGGAQYIIDSPMCQAIKNAVEQGVTVVVAAGNEAIDAMSYTPAHCPHSLTVSAFVDLNGNGGAPSGDSVLINGIDEFDETFAESFSNFGQNCWDFDGDSLCESPEDNPIVNIMAPGVNILSTLPTYPVTFNDPDFNKALDFDIVTGTSMATPHVAGAAANYLQANPGASPQEVRSSITNNGECPNGATVGEAGSAGPHSCPGPWADDPDPSNLNYSEPLMNVGGGVASN